MGHGAKEKLENVIIMRKHLVTFCLLLVAAKGIEAQNVEVTVTGIKSDKGQISVGIFLDNESFDEEKEYLGYIFQKNDMQDGTITFRLNLEPGLYGLSVLDDEDCNRKMKYGALGIPKEGFGFSDYYHTGFSKPKFDSFSFTVEKNTVKHIVVRMRYL